jgi:SAM-dependent methyltransferase
LIRTLDRKVLKPCLRQVWPWRYKTYGGIRVHYLQRLDGGGSAFGQDYIPLLRGFGMPPQERVFEWCAGPGLIGFSLLGHGLCRTLALADINPEAVKLCRRTVHRNGLADRVAVYHSDNLAAVPATEQWDLVVGNPPHFDDPRSNLRGGDPGWQVHRRFYANVGRHLKPGGIIVVQENNRTSTAATFRAMIEAAGLAVVFVHDEVPVPTDDDRFYYVGVMRPGDAVPAWAAQLPRPV